MIVAVAKTPRLRAAPYFLVVNIAISDLILSSVLIPCIIITRITVEWKLGTGACLIIYFINAASAAVAILTMMAISIERYIAICRVKSRGLLSAKNVLLIILGMWVIAISFFTPLSYVPTVMRKESCGCPFVFCYVQWPEGFPYVYYLGCMTVLFFITPFIVMIISYVHIWRTVHNSTKKFQPDRRRESTTSSTRAFVEYRLIKMFVVILIVFFITWMPFFILSMTLFYMDVSSTTFTATVIVLLSNTCLNPVIYGYFNEHFRVVFLELLQCSCGTNTKEVLRDTRTDTRTTTMSSISTVA